jgi:phosphoribosylanthranilate isomerase
MWIKICANTNLEDALLATELGADAVGFVFAASPRRVTAEQVGKITPHLPALVEKIGVFYSLDANEIGDAVRVAGLTGVQLHGGHSADVVRALREDFGEGLRIVQTNHWRVGSQDLSGFAAELQKLSGEAEIDAVLVDSRTAVADGGTGVTFDWEAAREALAALGIKPLIVAGGLNANNVAQAIAVLQPWGVDVASGVETSPGVKDPGKLKSFLEHSRNAGR